MKFTLDWLKDHLETNAALSEITRGLIQLGLEVEKIDDQSEKLKGFIVGTIIECSPHPNADRLNLCKVDNGQEIIKVVCGAPNVRKGLKVAFAPIGTLIPSTQTPLKKGTIRGEDSFGMLCSADELTLGDNSDGILELPSTAKAGELLADTLGMNDVVIEVSITPNRADCFSVRGIARDLAALGIGTLKPLEIQTFSENSSTLEIRIDHPDCFYFTGRILENVHNTESPDWMRKRLRAVGQKVISALVDVTNYLCIDQGHPLHVFDADKIGENLIIRQGKKGEILEGLDGVSYSLDEEMIVIGNQVQPLSLGGIMGGINSGCTLNTKRVFIESAYFLPEIIAKTGQKLNVFSEARTRFERGTDLTAVDQVLDFATKMILSICGGTPSKPLKQGTNRHPPKKVTLNFNKLFSYTSDPSLTIKFSVDTLKKLGFLIEEKTDQSITVIVPSWRHDINLDVDLIEEILRLRGYHHIIETPLPPKFYIKPFDRESFLKNLCEERGLKELYTLSLISEKMNKTFEDGIPLEKPLTEEFAILRSSFIPSHLKVIQLNQHKGVSGCAFFEITHVFNKTLIPSAHSILGGIRAGTFLPKHWAYQQRNADVFDVKEDVWLILDKLGIVVDKVLIDSHNPPCYAHPGRYGEIKQGKVKLAELGELHPSLLQEFDVEGPALFFQIYLDSLPKEPRKKKMPLFLSPYQSVTREFSFVMDESVPVEKLLTVSKKINSEIFQESSIIDIYKGPHLQQSKKSISIQVLLRALNRTLTEEDLTNFHEKFVAEALKTCQATLR